MGDNWNIKCQENLVYDKWFKLYYFVASVATGELQNISIKPLQTLLRLC